MESGKRARASPAGFHTQRPSNRQRIAWLEERLRRQQEAVQAKMPGQTLQALRTLAEGVNSASLVEVRGRVMALVEPATLEAARVAVVACQQQLCQQHISNSACQQQCRSRSRFRWWYRHREPGPGIYYYSTCRSI